MSQNIPPFSREEYDERLARVRKKMVARDVDLLLVHTPENIFYLTGYDTPGYEFYHCLLVPLQGQCEIIVRTMERENARRSAVSKYHAYHDLDDVVKLTVEHAHDVPGVRVVGVEKSSWFLTAKIYERLRTEFTPVNLTDCSNLIDELRMVKSAAEIKFVREAASICDTVFRVGIDAIHAGACENEIASAVSAAAFSRGGDYTGMPYLIKSGDRCAIGHGVPTRRRMERGDVVYMELSGCINRYHAVTMRTCQIGPVDDAVRRAADVIVAATDKTIAAMRPGTLTGELYNVGLREIAGAGLTSMPRRMAYSIGIGYPPRWDETHVLEAQVNSQTPLQPGMVFHVCPGARLSERAQIAFSETVLITETGPEILTNTPRTLITRA
ncbi:M24 family metallopeptidase [Bradyrhizobium elkanii]|uniref:M24 family metallopeptidase n=1 Tax=Bradyrhizobium elkanii TaxID=29448 RepID=UPI001BAC5549|nr:Xaa-Pro peptidase family protein [Bradyrhizobium elkanii]MBR1165237.1 aminopeptidase P family protein [Bradyrhizobium elkanii]